MKRYLILPLLIVATFACRGEEPDRKAAKPRTILLSSADRQPPADATLFAPETRVKVIARGDGAPVDEANFSGYGFTFYTDDGSDTGTELQMKSWAQTDVKERRLFTDHRAGDTLRVWDCASRTARGECRVFDYTLFGRASN